MKLFTFLILLSIGLPLCLAQVYTEASLVSNDIVALNYALTLEHLESTFYSTFQKRFSSADFQAAGYPSSVYPYFDMIAAHEAAHVSTLESVIKSLGGTPVAACTYNFSSVTGVVSYVALARILENTGVMAYDGAINTLTERSLQAAAASIATVEARHAEYLNGLNDYVPFPSNFDNATAPAIIATLITPLIVSCPQQLQLPQVLNITLNFATLTFANGTTISSPSQSIISDNDYKVVNFALILEHMEYTFYKKFQAQFTAADFVAAGYTATDYHYFSLIEAHEKAHVQTLTATLQAANLTPYPYCTYNFSSVVTVHDYIALADIFENTGVKAYDGSIDALTNKGFQELAATIATVEGRQAGYLNTLANVSSPFPLAFDQGLPAPQVFQLTLPFQRCSFTPAFPQVLNLTSTATAMQQYQSSPCPASHVCPASNLCCNDAGLGPVCYDPTAYQCFQQSYHSVLCNAHDAACGNICYDPEMYKCCSENNIQLSSEACSA